MKFSEQWLREWVNPPCNTEDLAHQLTMVGLEVGAIAPVAGPFSQVKVGEVKTTEKHPKADKLTICAVDIGTNPLLQIVCGAKNVRAGLKVAVACIGAHLPNGLSIKETQLRDVLSQGMLCSYSELGMTDSSDGIIELPSNAPIGADLRDYLQLNDHSIDIELTANRGDCLSIQGIAREVSVITQQRLQAVSTATITPSSDAVFPLRVTATAACPNYTGRVIRDVDVSAPSPLWLQQRLQRSGLRSIDIVVDITNYVMLELGQPLHGFDLANLHQEIVVRMAVDKETLTLLNGQTITLKPDTLVIADAKQVLAIAGVMGGEHSGVNNKTQHVFLESAFFAPTAIAGRARAYGLHTDASHRFERGVDPSLQIAALERATALLLELAGGKAGPICQVSTPIEQKAPLIRLRAARIQRLLGMEITAAKVTDILQRLGMTVQTKADEWLVKAPSYRFDIHIEEDLIEEVGRIYGYHHLPPTQPKTSFTAHVTPETQIPLQRLRSILVDRDYQEAITYSFVPDALQQEITPEYSGLALSNPLSPDLAVMRTSLWPGLLQALLYNQNRQQNRIRLFESGLRFIPEGNELRQEAMLAGLACGPVHNEQWGIKTRPIDFYDMKADLETLFAATGEPQAFTFEAHQHPALHPGQTAVIKRNGNVIGLLGILHPKLQHQLDINQTVCLFELTIEKLAFFSIPVYNSISKYPEIRRDIAIVIDSDITGQAICQHIQSVSGNLLKHVDIFDVYAGQGIEKGKKSIALSLTFQEPSRTLIDSEVNILLQTIVESLTNIFNATLRN